MWLYHVSFDCRNEGNKVCFIPRVPESAGDGENKEIKRICLCPSIEKCIQAIGSCNRRLSDGSEFLVYRADIDPKSTVLIAPERLFELGYVPDSLENKEYWYCKKLIMECQRCKIVNFDGCCGIAWTCVPLESLIRILRHEVSTMPEAFREMTLQMSKAATSSLELYNSVIKVASECSFYEFIDNLLDAVAELPWAQMYRINKIDFELC